MVGRVRGGAHAPEAERFTLFLVHNGDSLSKLAFLLARDRSAAEDLLQTALEKAFVRWSAAERADDPLAYVRRILVNAAIDGSRRTRRRPSEVPLQADDIMGFRTGYPDVSQRVGDRDELRRLLRELPPRQRAVVVLRYYADLSETEVAETLGISVGSVKTHASRGLARLRLPTPETTEKSRGR